MIITGCQRSGTKSAAEIFGIGHEIQFNPNTDYDSLNNSLFRLKPESSWLAAPFIPLIRARYPIIHLIRHPLAVINSMLGIEFWGHTPKGFEAETPDGHEPYRNFALRFCPRIEEAENPVDLSMHYYIFWNRMVQAPRIRIESIQNAPVANRRKRGDIQSWDDLPDGKLLEELKEIAGEYGYE